ncbi:proline-specific peptidase [Trametopsis cervina]|nr:proline-specific peptidase [Trametopsis cervina]
MYLKLRKDLCALHRFVLVWFLVRTRPPIATRRAHLSPYTQPSRDGRVNTPVQSSLLEGETYQTWYKLVGELRPDRNALVVLHGGPGLSHDYLIPLADLASSDAPRAVIFYDQLGAARSTHLPDKDETFYTIELFIQELENVLNHFGIASSFDVLGHSWGGMLAAEYIIRRQPTALKKVVLTNTLCSFAVMGKEVARLKKTLPQDVQDTLAKHEKAGTTDSEEYKQAMLVFYANFACRLDPMPKEVLYSLGQLDEGGSVVDKSMDKGDLKGWDITDKLHLIRVPTLLINGEYDYMTDASNWPFFNSVDKIKWLKFANSSHMPFFEEREKYMETITQFLESGSTP